MRAKAKNPRKPHEMTKAEKAFEKLEWFEEYYENRRYEAITLRVGKVRYTPDFSAVCSKTGGVCYFEVKASGHRAAFTEAARIKLKMFATAFSEYVFYVVWPDKKEPGGWHIEILDNQA